MKKLSKLPNLLLAFGFALALPLCAHAQTIVFEDSFENDGTGYNLPNSGSTPPYVQTDTGYNNTTVGDSHYHELNNAPTYITDSVTNPGQYVTGQVGNSYVQLNNNGGDGDMDGPPFTDRTPSAQTDTIATVNGSKASGHPGTFLAGATYTLSVLIAQPSYGDSSLSSSFSLYDGTTDTLLKSDTVQASTLTDGDFHLYSFTFNTGTDPSVVGDSIQIALTAAQTSAQIFGRSSYFDDVKLTVPEPSTWALMIGGVVLLAGLKLRSVSRRA